MTRTSQQAWGGQVSSTAELVDWLSRFDGPPEQFLSNLLAGQCQLASAQCGTILRVGLEGGAEVLAVYPPPAPGSKPPPWVARTMELAPAVVSAGKTAVHPLHERDDLYGQPASRHLVMIPLGREGAVTAVASFVVDRADPASLAAARERLELTVSLLSLYEVRLALYRKQVDLRRLRAAMETLSATNEHDRFTGAAMAFCNELASKYQADRVCLGFLKGRYVHLRAMSHTEKFSRKMKLVQDLEAGQEECLDQDIEVFHPAPDNTTFVNRAARELSARHGPTAVLSLPLRRDGKPLAVLTVERPLDKPFLPEEVEALRLTAELCTARLVNLQQHDRWIGARACAGTRSLLATLLGPKHTWVKLLAVLAFAAILFLIFAEGDYRVEAPFTLQATRQQVIAAPFDGRLEWVEVVPGAAVEADKTVLARLRTSELRDELAATRAEEFGYGKQADQALADGRINEWQQAEASAAKAAAQIRLLETRIGLAEIKSPISGSVVTGDLERQVGGPVKMGDTLFEVAPLADLRAELSVPEDDIAEVQEGMQGELATAAYPDRRIGFTVDRISPVAEVVNQRNVFKVRVGLHDRPEWMRPGMEGVAKVFIDRRHYASIWTRKLVNWARMKLWW